MTRPSRTDIEKVRAKAITRAEEIVSRELGETVERPPLHGLALSGGGIRSATFNLGVLQTLRREGLLEDFDYLSTVSGGGYVGGFWSAFRHRVENLEDDARFPPLLDDVFPGPSEDGGEAECVRHLRQFSNFLAPRLGLFSTDTWAVFGVLTRAVLPSILGSLSAIVLVLSGWLALAYCTLPGGDGAMATVVGLAVVFHLATEIRWRRRRPGDQPATLWYLASALVAIAVAARVAYLGAGVADPAGLLFSSGPLRGAELQALFFPTLAFASGGLVVIVLRFLTAAGPLRWLLRVLVGSMRRSGSPELLGVLRRATVDRATVRILALAVVWATLSGLWLLGHALYLEGAGLFASGVAGGAGGLFALVRRVLFRQPSKPGSSSFADRLMPILPATLAYAALLSLVAAVVTLLHHAFDGILIPLGTLSLDGHWVVALVAMVIVLVTLVVFDPEQVGFHTFYRNRLVRAYLGAANPDPDPRKWRAATHRDDDLPLRDLTAKPFHLVCCAANDLTPTDPLRNLQRGSRSATLSRWGLSIGGSDRRWSDPAASSPEKDGRKNDDREVSEPAIGHASAEAWPKDEDGCVEDGCPTLGSSITASAAAFNSLMGDKTARLGPAVTFLMTTLNLRLGLWILRPGRTSWWRRAFPGLLFYRELLGWTQAEDPWVHLSDGAHFENLGLYELLRRRCRYILVSDCGADPEVVFDDFARALRRAREDFGVEIDINLRPLAPDDEGLSRQPMVAGEIRYVGGDTGVLLYLKPTLNGNEPPDILQYNERNADFPHETTGDQFYDEAQWESYRRLGEHVSAQALAGPLRLARRERGSGFLAEVFNHARFAWQPLEDVRPEAFAGRLEELEELLEKTKCPELESEVNLLSADDELAACLPELRKIVSLLEEGYRRLDLERWHRHPELLGTINAFGRWLTAPTVLTAWPLLRAFVSPRFAHWAENVFELDCTGDAVTIGETETKDLADDFWKGYAATRWRRLHGEPPEGADRVFELHVVVEGTGLQAGLLFATREAGAPRPRLRTETSWLFVPPGLWGLGLGSLLVRRVVAKTKKEESDSASPPALRGLSAEESEAAETKAREQEVFRVTLDPEEPSFSHEQHLYRSIRSREIRLDYGRTEEENPSEGTGR